MEHKHSDSDSGNDNHSHGHHPLVPLKVYFMTMGALILLTIITVGASYIQFGSTLNVLVSLGIATCKASLVLMFFMGLKYDTNLNRAYILSSFVALMILLSMTASDLWTRPTPKPALVKSTTPPLSEAEFNALLVSNADQVARGKKVFDVNCATCHGTTGRGDGAGGASLSPKPRNFAGAAPSEWKNGSSIKSMYVTLAHGIPGSGMASYKALPPVDRIALIHYVHTFMKDVQATSKADDQVAAAKKEDGIGGDGAGAKVSLPIDFAIDRALKN